MRTALESLDRDGQPQGEGAVRPSTLYPANLTERDVEVLRLLARGFSNAEIAEQLVISPRTVSAHLRSIYSKLDVTTRSAATRTAMDLKLV
jgi:DNA-binding NarL/FixJ family response regulator